MRNESESIYNPDEKPEEVSSELFDVAVILGGGFRSDKPGALSLESKIRVLAAGVLAGQARINKLVLSGGITQHNTISEAQAMKEYLLENFDLEGFPIELEEGSADTNQNAAETAKRLRRDGHSSVFILTNEFHLTRATERFEQEGLVAEGLSAEELTSERSDPHRILMNRYLKSFRVKKYKAVEIILRGIAKIDKKGTLITSLAKKLRR